MNEKIIDKNYGSIPHLSTSKLTQQADKKIGISQEEMMTKKSRDWRDLIIVTEKLDGSNVGVYNSGRAFYPLTRAGYEANTSNYRQHIIFQNYVQNNLHLFDWLPDKWRITGEWCIQAHGTFYDITEEEPFVAFDIFDENNKRIPYLHFRDICIRQSIPMVPLLHIGQPISLKQAIKLLGDGHYGFPDKPEGVVYRMERDNKVDFLAKWVRSDKEDGKYMKEEIFNKGFELKRGMEAEP